MNMLDELIIDEEMVKVDVDWVDFKKRIIEIKRATVLAEQNAIAMACQTFLNA